MKATWHYVLTPRARRDVRRFDPPVRQRVFEALDRYVAERQGDLRKLRGKDDEWRLRVGDWRVRVRLDPQSRVVVVLQVLPRGRAYRG